MIIDGRSAGWRSSNFQVLFLSDLLFSPRRTARRRRAVRRRVGAWTCELAETEESSRHGEERAYSLGSKRSRGAAPSSGGGKSPRSCAVQPEQNAYFVAARAGSAANRLHSNLNKITHFVQLLRGGLCEGAEGAAGLTGAPEQVGAFGAAAETNRAERPARRRTPRRPRGSTTHGEGHSGDREEARHGEDAGAPPQSGRDLCGLPWFRMRCCGARSLSDASQRAKTGRRTPEALRGRRAAAEAQSGRGGAR